MKNIGSFTALLGGMILLVIGIARGFIIITLLGVCSLVWGIIWFRKKEKIIQQKQEESYQKKYLILTAKKKNI